MADTVTKTMDWPRIRGLEDQSVSAAHRFRKFELAGHPLVEGSGRSWRAAGTFF